jgi:hypothetical protein
MRISVIHMAPVKKGHTCYTGLILGTGQAAIVRYTIVTWARSINVVIAPRHPISILTTLNKDSTEMKISITVINHSKWAHAERISSSKYIVSHWEPDWSGVKCAVVCVRAWLITTMVKCVHSAIVNLFLISSNVCRILFMHGCNLLLDD